MSDSDLPPIEEVPAAHLQGRQLERGWTVGERLKKDAGATGGHFSICYSTTNQDGRNGFLKALNFHAATSGDGSIEDRLKNFTVAFTFERDLLVDCSGKRLSRVIHLLDHGHVLVPEAGPLLSSVPYLILEVADGDLRAFQARLAAFDTAWAFRVMKHSLQGLGQLHYTLTTHQDLKPSNVLTQSGGREMKLGDLGRADRRGIEGPNGGTRFAGALTYAPPEHLYRSFGGTWEDRKAADLFLAGSLGVQLFLGHCVSALIQEAVPTSHTAANWKGSFQEALPFLRQAHAEVIDRLAATAEVHIQKRSATDRFATAIRQMTDPDPAFRGHPHDRRAHTSSYDVQRYVSLMDWLMKDAEYRLRGMPNA